MLLGNSRIQEALYENRCDTWAIFMFKGFGYTAKINRPNPLKEISRERSMNPLCTRNERNSPRTQITKCKKKNNPSIREYRVAMGKKFYHHLSGDRPRFTLMFLGRKVSSLSRHFASCS